MRYLSLLSVIIFLVGCGGEEESTSQENDNGESNIDTTAVEETLVEGWGEEPDTNEVEVFIEDIPHSWILLSDEDGDGEDLIINKWCEAETQNFSLESGKGEEWEIYLGYGHEGETCSITFFEAFENEDEGDRVISGTFRFKASYDESVRFVDFWWNEDDKIGNFNGLGMGSEWFVPEEHKGQYTLVEEDCEGLWE